MAREHLSGQKQTKPGAPGDQKKTGYVKWFNVAKGFGFLIPHDGSPEVFVHQSVLQMKGFRSLDDNEEVEFICRPSEKGFEATYVSGLKGVDCKGSHRRPLGKSSALRCYNCGAVRSHRASACPNGPLPKACYQCRSPDHLVSECPGRSPAHSKP